MEGSHFQSSVLHVRNLIDVVSDMLQDDAMMKQSDFGGRPENVDPDEIFLGSRFTMFSVYGERRERVQERFSPTAGVRLLSLGMWLDEGEIDENGNPIYFMALFLLNAPSSLIRRGDCIFPFAYTYTDSDIVDAFRYLLPQFEALRDVPRLASDGHQYVAEIHLVTGDNPAITKLLMLMKSSSATIPCKNCFISNSPKKGEYLNDTTRWLDQE